MTGTVQVLENDPQFQPALTAAGTKVVVVDFFATWCGPCNRVAPVFVQFAAKYPKAVFIKVDVDKLPETAAAQQVTAMPTFIFYQNEVQIDLHKGADPLALEEKIKALYPKDEEGGDAYVPGHMDLITLINKSGCECLNESDDHPLKDALSTDKTQFLESDCDEQLIIALEFNQAVKLHSLKMTGPDDKGPKTIKIFINQPRTLDFDSAESMAPVQQLDLQCEDIQDGALVPMKYVKYQNVQNLIIFVKDNQGGEETTVINSLSLIGSPVNTTNMAEFKRVAGKKGESH